MSVERKLFGCGKSGGDWIRMSCQKASFVTLACPIDLPDCPTCRVAAEYDRLELGAEIRRLRDQIASCMVCSAGIEYDEAVRADDEKRRAGTVHELSTDAASTSVADTAPRSHSHGLGEGTETGA